MPIFAFIDFVNIASPLVGRGPNVKICIPPDADRIIMCDENGKIIDGDQIIAMLARRWKSKKILKGGSIGTLMSNYGLENFLFYLIR